MDTDTPGAPSYEDALIFANGDANDGAYFRRALAIAPRALCIAADGGAHHAAAFSVRLHAVIGDMDSIDAHELAVLAALGTAIYRYPEEKDETDLELALAYAARHGARRLHILGAVGDRLDQTLSNVYLMALPALRSLEVRLIAGRQASWLLYPGDSLIDGAPGDTLSLIPISGSSRGVTTDGLYYPLRDEELHFGLARGVSNVLTGDRARVHFRDGVLLVVHTLGKA